MSVSPVLVRTVHSLDATWCWVFASWYDLGRAAEDAGVSLAGLQVQVLCDGKEFISLIGDVNELGGGCACCAFDSDARVVRARRLLTKEQLGARPGGGT